MAAFSNILVERDVATPMRDGTVLRADVYRPAAAGQFPVLLMRTPYSKALPQSILGGDPLRMVEAGYAVMLQDTRGRFASAGGFYPFLNEANDGYDTVEWAASQPWSTGKVGTFGASYVGATQWLTATATPPHLAAIHPQVTASDYYEGWIYQGGAFALGFALSWALGLAGDTVTRHREALGRHYAESIEALNDALDAVSSGAAHLPLQGYSSLRAEHLAPYYYDWLAHPTHDAYWRRWSIEEQHGKITVPALNLGGWHDIFIKGTLRNYLGMKRNGGSAAARGGQHLIIGPWAHILPLYTNMVGAVDYGVRAAGAALDLDGMMLRWYDRWLKGIENGLERDAPVKLFIMGENVWRDEADWPLARAIETPYFFHGRGRANSAHGDGGLSPVRPQEEPADVYLYDPRHPVPTRGGGLCCPANIVGGAFDQRDVEERPDVLVYTGDPLAEPVEVTGPVRVILYASSSAVDTDFTAKLVDVAPSGYARNLTDSIVRARYREGTREERLLRPGQVEEFVIDLIGTANLFQRGHRIRVEVSSSNFPRFDRNPNTGHPFGQDESLAPALQTIYHDARYPSHIVLPIVPRR